MGREAPDWLPSGWKVNVKVRSCGRKDKYYVNPSNSLKFSSKPEVLRYLNDSAEVSKPKEPTKIGSEKSVAEKLPPGWIKEVRVRNRGGQTRRDPYYIDPVSGRHFRSMQEVFRHLESKDSIKSETKEEKSENHSKSIAEAEGQRFIDEKADKRVTRLASKKTESDLARGSKDVMANKVDKQEVKENLSEKREVEDSLAIDVSDRKLQPVNKVEPDADRMMLNKELSWNKGVQIVDREKTPKPGMQDFGNMKQRDGKDYAAGLLSSKQLPVNGVQQLVGGVNQNDGLTENKPRTKVDKDQSLQSGSEGTAAKISHPTESTGSESQEENVKNSVGGGAQHESVAHTNNNNNKRKKPNSKGTRDLPRRSSKRLARAAADGSSEVKRTNKIGTDAAVPIETTEVINTNSNVKNASSEDPTKCRPESLCKCSELNDLPVKCITENPDNNEQKAGPAPPVEDHLCKEDEEQEKNLDSSLENILMDPCIEFAIKTLTGTIPIEDVNKVVDSPVSSLASANETSSSASVLASGDIWADPCFEFAVKTLTGDMPVEECPPSFQISFQQPLSSSGSSGFNSITVQNSTVDKFFPSNYAFGQFDAVKMPHPRQEGLRDTSLPNHAINGVSPNLFMDASLNHGLARQRRNCM